MNRIIKFRGKRLKIEDPLQRWIDGTLAAWTDIYGNERTCIVSRSGYHNDVDPDTVGQFTGLFDLNGKEIYEGDVIESPCGNVVSVEYGYNEEVVQLKGSSYKDCFAAYGWIVRNLKNGLTGTLDNSFIQGKVIGNIHDNPELLKGE